MDLAWTEIVWYLTWCSDTVFDSSLLSSKISFLTSNDYVDFTRTTDEPNSAILHHDQNFSLKY